MESNNQAIAKDGFALILSARNKKAKASTKPNVFFINEDAVKKYGVLDAAIIGEMYFWFATGKSKFFRKFEDHSNFFYVSATTIGNHHKKLTEAGIFNRTRSFSKIHGGKLAYDYTIGDSPDANKFLSEAKRVLIKDDGKGRSDFGTFSDEYEFNLTMTPRTLSLLTCAIDHFKDLTTAYIYGKLVWVEFNDPEKKGIGASRFSDMARFFGINRNTLKRKLELLNSLGYIAFQLNNDFCSIVIDRDSKIFEEFESYMLDINESRHIGIMDIF
ncbi:hypothetical protein [Glaciecola petra]|uniref:Uncharacterized protein n=1 Tax=Glaciecola petra TaxID=3075602 RepID=A0ABU2ZTY2_9ALTE|nr:hypothetical protein [Aestuariibacter sp. P117]MDT0596102.1 hypothetical protein [Aestuariibacter sp. P117]